MRNTDDFFSESKAEIDYVLNYSHSGSVCINDTMLQAAVHDLPFGGVGGSGMGHYHGCEGFLTFSKAKSVLIGGKMSFNKWIYPPWGNPLHRLLFRYFLR